MDCPKTAWRVGFDMLPEAITRSRLPGRIRFQIPSKKGDLKYFQNLEKRFKASLPEHRIRASALTGSVVIHHTRVDINALTAIADRHQLFSLRLEDEPALPLAKRIALPIRSANGHIRNVSDGRLDLAGAIFLGLLAFGMWELAIGNFRRPPWYTAFWYAFGLFSKTIVDELRMDTQ
jgi:hypothetical protein